MKESIKAAYRHLGLTGYPLIQVISSELTVGVLSIDLDRINRQIKLIYVLSEWLGKLKQANVDNFENFDEDGFWEQHRLICEAYTELNLEIYRILFDDSK
jgi:hypothetical protein